MITLKNIFFSYVPGVPVLADYSLDIPDGKRICLTGESGRGKTTILRLITGLEKPDAGELVVPEKSRFSVVFQEDRLLPWLTILENVSLFADRDKSADLLRELGLGEFSDVLPDELSGGQRRRASLARALAHGGDIFLFDEPLTGLDQRNEELCLSVIDRETKGKTIVLVSHQARHAEWLGAEMRTV